MATERQLKMRTLRQLRQLKKAAVAFENALLEFDQEIDDIESDTMDLESVDFDVRAFMAEQSGMEYHSIYVGSDCWTSWEEGDEFYSHVVKLQEAIDAILDKEKEGER